MNDIPLRCAWKIEWTMTLIDINDSSAEPCDNEGEEVIVAGPDGQRAVDFIRERELSKVERIEPEPGDGDEVLAMKTVTFQLRSLELMTEIDHVLEDER